MQIHNFSVHIDAAANDKMRGHFRFLAQVSPPAAKRLRQQLNEAINFLKDSPKSCPPYLFAKAIDAELRYYLFGKRYRIVFEIDGSDVFIYDIQDCRQDTGKSLV